MSLQRVNRVTLENWRNWQGASSVEDLDSGVVVLFGPNAIGKTGVWEGIVGGLLDRHWGTHTTRLRPAGTKSVVPRVEVEFTAGDSRYRVEKFFGSSRDKASFWEWIDGEWTLRDQGEEAYLLCRRAVLGTDEKAPSRGGPEKAVADTLMEVLLPAQGALTAPAPAPEAVSMAVTDRDAATAATRLGRVLSAVSTEADGIWVGKRDRPRKGSTLQTEELRLEEIEEKIEPHRHKAEQIRELIRELEIATDAVAGQPDAAEQAQKAERLQREAREHRAKREAARERLQAADQALKDAKAAVADRTAAVATAKEEADRLEKLKRDLVSLEMEQKRAESIHRALREKRRTLTEEIRSLGEWADYENREAELATLRKSLEVVSGRLARHDEQERILAEKNAEEKVIKVPKKEDWPRLDDLREQLHEAMGRLSAGAWTVTGAVPPGLKLTVDGEEVEGADLELPATREVSITGDRDSTLRVSAPAESAAEVEVERLTSELSSIMQNYQVADASELRRRYNYLEQEVKPAISKAISRMEDALAGESRADLLREQFELGQRIEKTSAQGAPTSTRPERSPEDWKIRLDLLQADLEGLEPEFAAAGPHASVAVERVEKGRLALATAEQDSELSAKTLADHRDRHGPDDALAVAMREADARAEEQRAAWRRLDDDRAMAESSREDRAGKLASGLNEVLKAQARVSGLTTRIETLRQEDPEGALAALEAERAELLPRLRAARVHAAALRLLESSLSAEKGRVTEFIGEPVRERMQTWISYLLQDDSQVAVDETGRPAVIRNPTGQEVPCEDQSFGTREQVSILHRLAVADLLARESGTGVVLMLDDPFGHTDRGRRSLMMDILVASATKRGHQILIFTCRPEDFEGVGTHVRVDGR